jgi:hypothetical protein
VTEAGGLWVGEAAITDVARVEMLGVKGAIPTAALPVARPFRFRLIAHVDTEGTVRLLQRALVGTRRHAGTGEVVVDVLDDESGVAAYRSANPDARVFRVSSANFPFMDPVPLTGGALGVPNQALRGVVTVSRDDPVNPFLHLHAPLHDNKERRAEVDVPYDDDVEVFSVERRIELLFQPPDEANPDPRWGATVCGGFYSEEIYGLGGPVDASNRVIKVKGQFRLERALDAATLVQSP